MGRLIKQGCTGTDVRAVQDVLNFQVRRFAPLKVDGDFGPRTHARVVEFQKSNGLKADGVVGPKTLAKLLEEEQLHLTLRLEPRQLEGVRSTGRGIQPPRLIPPLTLPPITPPLVAPFFLPPNSFTRIPTLTPAGQTIPLVIGAPVRNDPMDPTVAVHREIVRLLERLPMNFPFRAEILKNVPAPVKKVGPLELDPVTPMHFGFKWGVKPLFDLESIAPPLAFRVGAEADARYVLKLIDRPGRAVPQLGLFGQGDFKGTIDWTSESAQSRPLLDLKGSFMVGIQGAF